MGERVFDRFHASNHIWRQHRELQGYLVRLHSHNDFSIPPSASVRYIEPIYQNIRKSTGSGTAVLEFAILGLLKEQDLHGYELRKRLGHILGPIGRLSFGTLYPALSRLESNGAVAVIKVTESRTGLTTQRGRKIYGVTKVGQAHFDQLLDSAPTPEDDRSFALRLAFARYLPREARLRLLMRRRDQLAEQVDIARQSLEARRDRLDGYGSSLMEHRIEVAQNDVSWLDRMISSEQQGALENFVATKPATTPKAAEPSRDRPPLTSTARSQITSTARSQITRRTK